MNYWPRNGEAELESLLLTARNNFAAFNDVIYFFEDDGGRNVENEYEQYIYTEDECRSYFLYMLDTYILTQKKKIAGVSPKLMHEILLMSFGLHKDYPVKSYPSIQDRRIAFATDHGLVKRSDKPESVAHLLWWKENKGIASLASAIKVEMISRERENATLSFGSEVWHRYNKYDLYADERIIDELGANDALYNEEKLDFPEQYTKLTTSAQKYTILNPSALRTKLNLVVPYNALRTDEDIAETMKLEEIGIRKALSSVLRFDPVFTYMVVRGIADLPYDPFIGMPTVLVKKQNQPEVAMPVFQGQIMGAKYSWVKEAVSLMDAARDAAEQSPEKWVGGAFAAWYVFIWIGNAWLCRKNELAEELSRNLISLLEQMPFRGVVYARSSRNYRILPQSFVNGDWCLIEEKQQMTCDWLVFDYLNKKKKHAFSIGFRPDVLRFAVFTPVPPVTMF